MDSSFDLRTDLWERDIMDAICEKVKWLPLRREQFMFCWKMQEQPDGGRYDDIIAQMKKRLFEIVDGKDMVPLPDTFQVESRWVLTGNGYCEISVRVMAEDNPYDDT